MKIALTLLSCSAMALLLTALTSHHQAVAPSPHKTSEALADAMSSHGIELGDADIGMNTPAASFKPVAYKQIGTQ